MGMCEQWAAYLMAKANGVSVTFCHNSFWAMGVGGNGIGNKDGNGSGDNF